MCNKRFKLQLIYLNFQSFSSLFLEKVHVVTIEESRAMIRNILNIAPGEKLDKPCKQKIARRDLTRD